MNENKGVDALIRDTQPLTNVAAMQQQRRQAAGLATPNFPEQQKEKDEEVDLREVIDLLREQLVIKDKTIADLIAINKALADTINATHGDRS